MVIPGIKGMSLRAFLKLLYQHFQDHALPDRAAQLAYYFVFALFPFLFFLVTLTAYLPVQVAIETLFERASELMPPEALDLIRGQVDRVVDQPRPKLVTGGFVVAVWSASRGVDAIRTSLNLAYDVKESRSYWKVQGIALLMTVAGAVLILVAVTLIALGGKFGFWLAQQIEFGNEYLLLWSVLRWPVTALVIMLVLALTYYLLPDVEQEFKFITPGSVVGSILWLLATWGFTFYAEHFGNYNVTYGSIGGMTVLLTWVYIGGLIFVVGGEMNAIIEQASTEGKEVGARAVGQPSPPPSERASAAPPGATKTAASARRSRLGFWKAFGHRLRGNHGSRQ
jgi:membrane protein